MDVNTSRKERYRLIGPMQLFDADSVVPGKAPGSGHAPREYGIDENGVIAKTLADLIDRLHLLGL